MLNLAQCLLFAGFSWMLQMWAREGLQICVCGTLHSFLSSALLLSAVVHAVGVTCGLCMTKNAGMWTRGWCMGGTCPSTCVAGVCPAVQPRWLCLGSEVGTNDTGKLWYLVPEYFGGVQAVSSSRTTGHCFWIRG